MSSDKINLLSSFREKTIILIVNEANIIILGLVHPQSTLKEDLCTRIKVIPQHLSGGSLELLMILT